MCGIYFALSRWTAGPVPPTVKLLEALKCRGPDHVNKFARLIELDVSAAGAVDGQTRRPRSLSITCAGTVLSLRGDEVVSQPRSDDTVNVPGNKSPLLYWNGEAWSFNGAAIQGNDTAHVFHLLSHVIRSKPQQPAKAISEALASYAGPYAFVVLDPISQYIYFGRDPLGRRSLLFKEVEARDFLLSSVSDGTEGWREVEADGIYSIDLTTIGDQEAFPVVGTPYHYGFDSSQSQRKPPNRPLVLNQNLPQTAAYRSDNRAPEEVHSLQRLLEQSVRVRVRDVPTQNEYNETQSVLKPARAAVLFSGGLDCTLLARLAHDQLPHDQPIDLVNVAFENPRVHGNTKNDPMVGIVSPFEQCPDRQTGRASFSELQQVCPLRKWRFIAVNVPYEEYLAHKSRIIMLMYPHNTEMDLSISAALYFAARGSGIVMTEAGGDIIYTTSARVLLSGLGADELFGGYTRHGTAFQRAGYQGLIEELELDVSRLGKRNLGRDDRVISNWAREARYPFLDEALVNWTLQLPVWKKCGFGQPADALVDPAKQLLRLLAVKLGMPKVAKEKKRAIQFGARTAKMEAKKTKGTDVLVAGE